MIIYTDWLNRDNREYYACFRYILKRCCKYKVVSDDEGNAIRIYKPIDFMDMKWIIDRCNYLVGKDFNVDLFRTLYLIGMMKSIGNLLILIAIGIVNIKQIGVVKSKLIRKANLLK